MTSFFDDGVADQPFAVFDGHALFLVRVPHGVPIKTNGTVIAEFAPVPDDRYLDMLIERSLRGRPGK